MDDFKILGDLIKFNTIKDKQNQEIINYIEKILLKKGLKTEYKGKCLVMSTVNKDIKLGFLGHTDTVEYIEGWDTNPFELTEKDNKLYGLGVADMKGGIAAMLDAIDQTDLSKLKIDKNENYEIPYTTMNVGLIKGGSAKNSVSANCDITIDVRAIKNEHVLLLKEKMKELSNKYDCIISVFEEVESFFNEVQFTDKTKTASFITEASLVKNSKRMILDPGPVTAHEVNEYITVESYKKLVEQYKEIINKACKKSALRK